jgi:hypothetical protein
MSKGKGAGIYMTAQELEAIDNALDLISTTLESASVIPPELANASTGLYSLKEKFHAVHRRERARQIRGQRGSNAVSLALAMISEEERAAGSVG